MVRWCQMHDRCNAGTVHLYLQARHLPKLLVLLQCMLSEACAEKMVVSMM